MINFDALTLKVFLDENKDFIIGSRIQKIQQPGRYELIFHMRNKGETRKFYINFNPNFCHLCFMSGENEKKRNIIIPKAAPMFCMLLRKYIQNAVINNIAVPKGERIFELYFEYYDEMNEKSQLCLAVELMGKYSNIILYNYDTNVIIGCAHNVSSEKSRERELSGLLPYVYPKKQNRKNLLKVSFESFLDSIDNNNISASTGTKYLYLTAAIVEQINKSAKSKQELYEKLKEFLSGKKYSYNISEDFSKFFLFEFENSFTYNNVNELIDTYFSFHQNKFAAGNLRQKNIKLINNQLKRLSSLKEKQEEQIKKLDKALEYKNKGDILSANIYALKNIKNKTELYDFEGNKITIELDENLSAAQNITRYYNLYKKTKTAYDHAKIMIENTNSELLYFEEQKFYTLQANDIETLKEIYNELSNENNKTDDKSNEIKIEFIEYQGFRIYIGKNKKQNDYILSKISSADDMWFHPQNAAGAHILVKRTGNGEITDNIILKAAQITKEYSSQRNNSKTPIIYTKRKYVKKANNKIAFVTYKNETEIIV
ncbi:MAG: NFACT family protein [Candidatus Avigastranaerophilus sp.]